MDSSWKAQLTTQRRKNVVSKIMETLKIRMSPNQSNLNELLDIAIRFEHKMFQSATDQQDYFWQITTKLLTLESGDVNIIGDDPVEMKPVTAVPAAAMQMDSNAMSMPQQLLNREYAIKNQAPMQLQPQAHQLLSQSVAGAMVSSILQGTTGSPNVAGVTPISLENTTTKISNPLLSDSQNVILMSRLQQLQQERQRQQQRLLFQDQIQQNHLLVQKMQQQQKFLQQEYQPSFQHQQQQSFPQQQTQLLDQLNGFQGLQQQKFLQQECQPSFQHQQQQSFPQQETELLDQLNGDQGLQQKQLLIHHLQQLQQQISEQKHVVRQQQAPLCHQQEQNCQSILQKGFRYQQTQSEGSDFLVQRQAVCQSYPEQKQHMEHNDSSVPIELESIKDYDEQDVVCQKLQNLKDQYFQQLKDLYAKLSIKSQQLLQSDQLVKLKQYKDLIQRIIPYLTVTKGKMPKDLNQARVETLERHILLIMQTFKGSRLPTLEQQDLQKHLQPYHLQKCSKDYSQYSKVGEQESLSPKHQQQMVLQRQQSEKHMHHPGQFPGTAAKPNESLFAQDQMTSAFQSFEIHPGRTCMPSSSGADDLQLRTEGMLKSVVANSLPQTSCIQIWQPLSQVDATQLWHLVREHEQLHGQKCNEHISVDQLQQELMLRFQKRQGVEGCLKANQVDLQCLPMQQQIKQMQLWQHQQAFGVGSPQAVPSRQNLFDSLAVRTQQRTNVINAANFANTQQIIGTSTQTSLLTAPSSSFQSVNSPQEVDSSISKSGITTDGSAGSVEYPESTFVSSGGIALPKIGSKPFIPILSAMPSEHIREKDGLLHVPLESPTLDGSISAIPSLDQLKKIDAVSSKSSSSAVEDIHSTVCHSDILGSLAPDINSRDIRVEDLGLPTEYRIQGSLLNEGSKYIKRKSQHYDSIPLCLVSEDGSMVNGPGGTSFESSGFACTRTPAIKKQKKVAEMHLALRREIHEINKKLVDTCVEIDESVTEEDAAGRKGLMVSCMHAVSASNPTESDCHQILLPPLKLLVPPSYPYSSPIIWSQSTPCARNSVASAVMEEFICSTRCLPHPISLEALAIAWDTCTRNALMDMAESVDGCSFSSALGVWQSCKTS